MEGTIDFSDLAANEPDVEICLLSTDDFRSLTRARRIEFAKAIERSTYLRKIEVSLDASSQDAELVASAIAKSRAIRHVALYSADSPLFPQVLLTNLAERSSHQQRSLDISSCQLSPQAFGCFLDLLRTNVLYHLEVSLTLGTNDEDFRALERAFQENSTLRSCKCDFRLLSGTLPYERFVTSLLLGLGKNLSLEKLEIEGAVSPICLEGFMRQTTAQEASFVDVQSDLNFLTGPIQWNRNLRKLRIESKINQSTHEIQALARSLSFCQWIQELDLTIAHGFDDETLETLIPALERHQGLKRIVLKDVESANGAFATALSTILQQNSSMASLEVSFKDYEPFQDHFQIFAAGLAANSTLQDVFLRYRNSGVLFGNDFCASLGVLANDDRLSISICTSRSPRDIRDQQTEVRNLLESLPRCSWKGLYISASSVTTDDFDLLSEYFCRRGVNIKHLFLDSLFQGREGMSRFLTALGSPEFSVESLVLAFVVRGESILALADALGRTEKLRHVRFMLDATLENINALSRGFVRNTSLRSIDVLAHGDSSPYELSIPRSTYRAFDRLTAFCQDRNRAVAFLEREDVNLSFLFPWLARLNREGCFYYVLLKKLASQAADSMLGDV